MARHTQGRPLVKEVVMVYEIGPVLGHQATSRLATSALPWAPVLPEPRRRQHTVTRRLLSVLTGHGRGQA
jgi:hypothetical protein